MTLTTLLLSESNQKVTFRAKGSGEPLVLIHGVGMQSAAWTPQLDHFAGDYRVIAPDLPGHGGSAPLPIGSELPDYVAWCRAFLDGLGLGPVNIAGHSMGALIAGGMATCHPDLIARAALLNGVFLRAEAAKKAVQARAAEIRNGIIDIETPLVRWFDDHHKEARAQVAMWLRAVDQTGYATAYTAFAGGDATYANRLAQVTGPFLAMTGDGDPNSTPAMSQAMADRVQNGRAVTLTGHRHMINLTAPDDVNAYLTKWLQTPLKKKDKS